MSTFARGKSDLARAMLSTERMLALLMAVNVPDQAAAWAVDLIPLYVTATAFEESVQRAWTEEDLTRLVTELRQYFSSLDADRFPLAVALAGAMTAGASGDQRFEFDLQVIVAGLASMIPPATDPSRLPRPSRRSALADC